MITLIHNWNVKEDTIQLKTQEDKMDSPLNLISIKLKVMLINIKLNNKIFFIKWLHWCTIGMSKRILFNWKIKKRKWTHPINLISIELKVMLVNIKLNNKKFYIKNQIWPYLDHIRSFCFFYWYPFFFDKFSKLISFHDFILKN